MCRRLDVPPNVKPTHKPPPQWRALTRAPGRVVQLLDGQIRIERGGTAAQSSAAIANQHRFFRRTRSLPLTAVVLALDPLRCLRGSSIPILPTGLRDFAFV